MTLLYEVVKPFKATTAISGRERCFEPGETFSCDSARPGENVVIEVDVSSEAALLFLVDRATFKACCEWKNEGAPL
jgi:hypothetical protein